MHCLRQSPKVSNALARTAKSKNRPRRFTQDTAELIDITLRILTGFDRELIPGHPQGFRFLLKRIRIRLILTFAPWTIGKDRAKSLSCQLLKLIELGLRSNAQSTIK